MKYLLVEFYFCIDTIKYDTIRWNFKKTPQSETPLSSLISVRPVISLNSRMILSATYLKCLYHAAIPCPRLVYTPLISFRQLIALFASTDARLLSSQVQRTQTSGIAPREATSIDGGGLGNWSVLLENVCTSEVGIFSYSPLHVLRGGMRRLITSTLGKQWGNL